MVSFHTRIQQICQLSHHAMTVTESREPWAENTSRNSNFKRRLAVVGNVGVYGSQWVAWAFIQALERYVYILCVCAREVDGEERGVPADAVAHLLDKSLICVTQGGIMGYWEEKNGTLNTPFKPDARLV